MKGFPNELLWEDGELFPGKWGKVKGDSYLGLYCQKVPVQSFLERLFTRLDLLSDRREAAKRVMTFEEKLTPFPNTRFAHSRKSRTLPGIDWVDEIPNAVPFPEVPNRPWWHFLRPITIEQRAYGLRWNKYNGDSVIRDEIEKGEWD